jgi:S-formylglutathione hydrolase FrmB
MKSVYNLLVFIFYALAAKAGTVDTVAIYSNSMHKHIKAVIIKPDSYKLTNKKFPVVYLLHGYDGWYSNWIIRAPELKNYTDTYQIIIVCPDGANSSWYFDSPVDKTYRYETHITTEVVGYIDKNYRTIADKKHRAITGLSMGGHGALFLALRHPSVFGAAGSMSGLADLKESKNRFEISKRIGDTITHAKYWHNLSVINLIENYKHTKLKIFFDCGNKDIFIEGNRRLHQKMLWLKIPHQYIERPGEHNWNYWRNAIPFQLLYFHNFFQQH